ncbi:MAG: MFS transporter [Planctomycetota bacterium]
MHESNVIGEANKVYWLQLVGSGDHRLYALHFAAVCSHARWPRRHLSKSLREHVVNEFLVGHEWHDAIPLTPLDLVLTSIGTRLKRFRIEPIAKTVSASDPLMQLTPPSGAVPRAHGCSIGTTSSKAAGRCSRRRLEIVPDDGSLAWAGARLKALEKPWVGSNDQTERNRRLMDNRDFLTMSLVLSIKVWKKPGGPLASSCSRAASWTSIYNRYTFGLIVPQLEEEYGWSTETVGDLAGVFNLSYALGQVPSGMICDWFGPHLFLGFTIVGWSIGLLPTAFLDDDSVDVRFLAILQGFVQAGCYPALSKMTCMWFPVASDSAQGWIASFFGRLGKACSNILFGTVLLSWPDSAGVPRRSWSSCSAAFFRHPLSAACSRFARQASLGQRGRAAVGGPGRSRSAPPPMTRVSLPLENGIKNGNFVLFFSSSSSASPDLLYVYMIPARALPWLL